MSELIVVRGPGKGASIGLVVDRGVIVGAGIDADIRVAGEDIATEHVVVKALKGGGFGAKALAGQFLLNGRPTAAARLSDGDVLRIGDCEIRYDQASATEKQAELAGFTLLGVLGRGGMGVVWRAEQKSLGREVALKVLSAELTADPVFVGRFQAEARAAARLHHPNVVQVFDVDHDGDTWFYSMELMHGGSLETRIKREGRLGTADAVQAIRDAAKGLAFAEQVQLVHRDIKPDNLMIDRHGHVKLADLGLAPMDDDGDTKLRGTPHFMSPEQVQRKPLDHRSDLYSLGCTFYRLLTGRTPFTGQAVKDILRAHLNEAPVPANKLEPSVPAEVAAIVDRLMAKDPDARYQSANDVVRDLDAAVAPPAKKGIWIAAAAVAVVSVGVAIWFATREREKIVQQVGDPEAEARLALQAREALAQKAQADAEIARLRVKQAGLEGNALADALAAMAAKYPDTKASKDALEEAQRVRQAVVEAEARAAARASALAEEIAGLESAVDTALASLDLPAALAAATRAPNDPGLATATELGAARTRLRTRIAAAAATALGERRGAIETAESARDPVAMERLLDELSALVAGQGAWPDELVKDRPELERWLAERRTARTQLALALQSEAESAALDLMRRGLFLAQGPLEAIDGLRFALAAERLTELASSLGQASVAPALTGLAPSLRRAEAYFVALEAAAPGGELSLTSTDGTALRIVGFTREDGAPKLSCEGGPRTRPEPHAVDALALRSAPLAWLPELPSERDNRAAAIAWLALARQLRATRAYLADLRPDLEESGTGASAYPLDSALNWAAAALTGTEDAELAPLAKELAAAALVARGLQAFATRRNTTAATLLERAFAEHASALVVRAQR